MHLHLIQVHEGELAVVVEGSGPPLVFLHGFPLDHSMWSAQISRFAAERTVIAPDLRGFGRSSVSEGIVGMDLLADDLAALLEALAIQQSVCLCGLSMGGYVAFQFALRHRSWLDGGGGLILCDTRAEADTDEGRQAREQTAQRVLAEGPEFLADTMVERLFSGGTRRRAAESGAVPTREALLVERTKTVMRQTSRRGLAAAARGMAARPDMTPWLPTFDFPALVLCGADDAITPPTVMRDLAARLPRATYVEIPGAGHMAPLEAPETVNVAIAEFLSSLS